MDASVSLSLFNAAKGYAPARVIATAEKMGLLEVSQEAVKPEVFAAHHGVSQKGVRLLCNALVALGVFEKKGEDYRLKEELRSLFTRFPELHWDLRHQDHLYRVWERLEEGVRMGHSPDPPEDELARYPHSLEVFLRAMHAHARLLAPAMMAVPGWKNVRTLLDIGGGGAGFALSLTRRFKTLNVTLLDLPEPIAITEAIVRERGDKDGRIRPVAANGYTDPLPPGPFDRILVSHLLHIYPPEDNRRLIRKATRRLERGGDLWLLDYFLDEAETGPREAVLFRLLMLMGTPQGDCYPCSAARAWLEEAGLVIRGTRFLGRGNTLIIGGKP